MALKIYLAGPDVFLPHALEVGQRKLDMCRSFGFEGLFPLDNDADVGRNALDIFRANCALMDEADIGLFNLTPFRGPSADAGTVFELGFMFKSGKPVYGYSSDPRIYRERVSVAFGAVETDDGLRDDALIAIEDFGLYDNLMIVAAIMDAGGTICTAAEPEATTPEQAIAAFAAFAASLEIMRDRVGPLILQKRIAATRQAAARGARDDATRPAFEYENDVRTADFNLRPRRDLDRPIPKAQAQVAHDVYEARNILTLLRDDNAFVTTDAHQEFIRRVTEAGDAGCCAPYVDPDIAAKALEQIRADIVRRVGTPLVYRYLRVLAGWAGVGALLGLAIVLVGQHTQSRLQWYGWVEVSAMVGAWFLVAAGRWQVAFETIPDYVDIHDELLVRLLFAGVVAAIAALVLDLGVFKVEFGTLDFTTFTKSAGVAVLLGLVAGVAARAMSVKLIDRMTKALEPSKR